MHTGQTVRRRYRHEPTPKGGEQEAVLASLLHQKYSVCLVLKPQTRFYRISVFKKDRLLTMRYVRGNTTIFMNLILLFCVVHLEGFLKDTNSS